LRQLRFTRKYNESKWRKWRKCKIHFLRISTWSGMLIDLNE
jgi:hypothetical protein